MRQTTLLLTLSLSLALSFGCTASEPEQAESPVREAGAGQIFKAADGLDAIVPAGAQIEKLAGGFTFIEGPLWVRGWDASPFLLFSDVRGNAIHKWDPASGEVSDFKNPVFEGEVEEGRFMGSNGLILDKDGNLLVCEHGNRRISSVTPEGQWSVLVDEYEEKKLNSPNDLVWHSNGWLYFTDPPYGLAQMDDDPAKEIDFNGVFRFNPADGTLEALAPRQSRPNGIAFSPDEKTLYVSNSDASEKAWFAYDVLDDGTLGSGRVFYDVTQETAEGAPDGLKVDRNGNVFATGPGGVWIFSPDGTHLGTIQPEEVPANVAWGDDGSTLYMTARTGLYRIKLSAVGNLP